jgi:hypothetical protein
MIPRLLAPTLRDLSLFVKFLGLLAGRTGQLLNLSQISSDAGVSHTTARQWLSLLEAGFIVHLLPPWFANLGKRLVKAPKLYFVDVGLACYLLGITAAAQLARHPLRGALLENLVVLEALKGFHHRGLAPRMHFYRDSNGNEVDLLLGHGTGLYAVEVKAGATVASDYFKGLARFAALMAGRLGAGAGAFLRPAVFALAGKAADGPIAFAPTRGAVGQLPRRGRHERFDDHYNRG